MSSFESYDKVFQCSVKQAKKLVKNPKVQVFVAIVQSKYQQLALDADELAAAHEFGTVNFKDCEEFSNNVICLDQEKLDATQLHIVHNILHENVRIRCASRARVYQRSDLFVSAQVDLGQPQILAGNKIVVSDVRQLEALSNLPQILYCNAFLAPSLLVSIATEKVRKSATILANVVLPKDQAVEAGGLVQQVVDRNLAVGSSQEYTLALHDKGQGLAAPNGAAKHLLQLDNAD